MQKKALNFFLHLIYYGTILSVLFSSLALFSNFIVNFLTLVMQFLFTSAVFSRIMALTRLAHG